MSNTVIQKEVITANQDTIIASMKERGIEYEIVELEQEQPDGTKTKKKTIMIKSVPPLQRDLARFFASFESPCWFKGCEEVRKQFKEAIDAAGGESGCKGCVRGRIIQQFTPIVEKLLAEDTKRCNIEEKRKQALEQQKNEPEEQLSPTRTISLPGSGSSSTTGADKRPSLLRRAAASIKKIFGIGQKA